MSRASEAVDIVEFDVAPPTQVAGPGMHVPPRIIPLEQHRRLHFIGVGGVGMSAIAQLCIARGFKVSGSDLKGNTLTAKLQEMGGTVHVGHAATNVQEADAVVISTAINPENPEFAEALRRNLPVYRRAAVLGWLMHDQHGIAIAGAHGKTTTTTITSCVLQAGELDPTLLVGGEVNGLGTNMRQGQSKHVVVEADESDGSFLMLPCKVVVVTNIDNDHLDYYKNMETMESAYVRFINAVGPNGLAILCVDDERVRRILPRIHVPKVLYGFSPEADLRVTNLIHHGRHSTYQVMHRGEALGPFTLNVPGRHNVLNSLASIAVGRHLGLNSEQIGRGVSSYAGVKRRFQFIGEAQDVKVYDDYAHHPTEIRATLASARLSNPKRLVAIFQPHRFSRTAILAEAFSKAFEDADLVLLMPIYGAGEKVQDGISSEKVYQMMVAQHPYVIALQQQDKLENYVSLITSQLDAGDMVFTVGAGDVCKMGQMILDQLNDKGN